MSQPTARPTLRDLPLPAKLVVSMFLISVGVGYFSALVQLHMQHSGRDGEPMPSVGDVVEKFSGMKEFDGVLPASKLETILLGSATGSFDKNNMVPAFYAKSSGYDKECKADGQASVDAGRHGEHQAFLAWLRVSDPAERKKAYDDDKFALPAELAEVKVTDEFYDATSKTVMVRSLLDMRCNKCHGEQKPEMSDYAHLEPLTTAPKPNLIDGKWVRSTRQVSVEGLTQSTHAHLLSFSMLFSLTGIIFAFTSYPVAMRATLGPVVLLFQLLDISCWWLARLDTVGPTFATMIIGTGGVVGLGLAAQIVLSLFNLYGVKGKAVLVAIFLAGAASFGTLVVTVIEPTLKAEKAAKLAAASEPKPLPTVSAKAEAKKPAPAEEKADKPEEKAKDEGPEQIPESKD